MKGLSEKIEKTSNSATTAKLKIAFKSHFMTVIEPTYVGEIDRTTKKCISEHKQTVRKFVDKKYGIDVHVLHNDYHSRLADCKDHCHRTWIQIAIVIQSNANTMNLDCGLTLSKLWFSSLELPPITEQNIFIQCFFYFIAQFIYLLPVYTTVFPLFLSCAVAEITLTS